MCGILCDVSGMATAATSFPFWTGWPGWPRDGVDVLPFLRMVARDIANGPRIRGPFRELGGQDRKRTTFSWVARRRRRGRVEKGEDVAGMTID